ncbi:MAG TPA: prenyltransferase/squalene oxidase repeat-containing protein [Solirubrobacteraceae bacterium]
MSWQLASFGILAVALAGGFAWYEGSHSDARTVALVATLAALAALGRIAFAAIPNVKPTTDIVLISGYALGGAPGFAVGAIAGLTSNFFFGQGPWTPWQMAAWGATAIIGAGLALITARRIGRWPLAIICGVVGFAFAAFQDVGDWVTYSDHSAAQLGVYVGKGIGFDFIHAAGCVVFALAFGPALIRSIQRFARRLHVDWGPARPAHPARPPARPIQLGVVLAALGVLLASQPGGILRPVGRADAQAAQTPTSYLLNAQNSDGGLGPAPGQASTSLFAGWAALGLAAEGHNPLDVRHGGSSLMSYIQSNPGGDPGSIERTVLVLHAAGEPAGSLLTRLEQLIRPNGSVQNQVNLTAFAVLALRAAGVAPSSKTLAWLVRQQDRDGGYNFATAGGTSDIDDTGAALEALAGAPGATRARGRAVAFLRRQQERDGGFPQQPGGETNSQSTAWAAQGLIAAGVSPSSVHRAGSPSPFAYLTGLIAPDGHVRYSHSVDQTPVWTTGQALTALAGRPLPLNPVAGAASTPAVHHAAAAHTPKAAGTTSKSGVKENVHANNGHHKAPAHAVKAPPIRALAADAAAAAVLVFAPVNLG